MRYTIPMRNTQSLMPTLLNLLFPPRCLTCEEGVPRHGTLCAQCWSAVGFIAEPLCATCGLPLEFALDGGEGECAECAHKRPRFSRARAVMRYDDASSRLIMALKYHDDTRLAAVFAPWLASAGRELLQSADLLVPVPLHYWRFVKRRYNQAALLARTVAKHTGKPCLPDALRRTRPTASQTGLSKREREANMRGAFAVNPRHAEALKGRSILLIDDVYTTGATLNACTRALMGAGAAGVSALTLARRS